LRRISRTSRRRLVRLALLTLILPASVSCRDAADPAHLPMAITATAASTGPRPTTTIARPARRELAEPSTLRFREVSGPAGVDFLHCSGKTPAREFPTANGSGVALLDFDGDGRLDLYFASTRELPLDAPTKARGNRLFKNRGDGTFADVTDRAGVGFRGFNHGVTVGDFDNNGFPDLYLANLGGNVLYLNRGDGTFRDASRGSGAECGLWCSGAAPLDYDRDGDLDLYVTCYGQYHPGGGSDCGDPSKGIRTYCSPKSITPERHFLLRNRGDATFEDVTKAAGILRKDGRGLGVVAADVNRDGLIDLYVANDISPHFLFLNKGDGSFEDISESSGASASGRGQYQAGMGVDAEDVDGDGLPELFVTHFREDYNTLYKNIDGRLFQDVSSWAGIIKDSSPNVGWGCALADLDNDGWPDMLVVNGHVDDNLDLLGLNVPQAEPTVLWRNRGNGKFRRVVDAGPYFGSTHVARGAAFGDLDDDGDLDVVVSQMDDHPAILMNESAPASWIRLELLTGRPGRPAIGAMVEVRAEGGRTIHRQLKGGGSYLSSNDPRLLVGLGKAERVERVDIRWPNGERSSLDGPATRQTHRVQEPPARGRLAAPEGGSR
jgi:hypothetical protein